MLYSILESSKALDTVFYVKLLWLHILCSMHFSAYQDEQHPSAGFFSPSLQVFTINLQRLRMLFYLMVCLHTAD